ncbi:hypothetical protein ACXWOE_09545, partial [Streptococcus pyogenes]
LRRARLFRDRRRGSFISGARQVMLHIDHIVPIFTNVLFFRKHCIISQCHLMWVFTNCTQLIILITVHL